MWRRAHARHHATNGNLNHRGHGDVQTLTVDEYLARSLRMRLAYRLYRNPFIMFTVGAAYLFFIQNRLTLGLPQSWRRERTSVMVTNLSLVAMMLVAWATIGLGTFLMIWLPVALLGASIGCWLFFVQHQYEDAYWQPQQSWSFEAAALEGSSYYRLPRVLQWFSGNIGFHHIHHLNSRIPGYHLPACFAADPRLRECPTFGIWESLKCPSLKLWDAKRQRMIGFADLHAATSHSVASG
jgi:omega-6 fatty acid desaturase (delta-12 desaturase)